MRIDFQNGYYGTLHYNAKTKTDDFIPCGREVTLNKIFQSVESNDYTFELKYDYGNNAQTHYIARGDLEDTQSCKALADVGIDIRHKKLDVFAESIYVQEKDYLASQTPNYGYKYLGWVQTPLFSGDGSMQWCYKASKILTPTHATMGKYLGNLKINPMGSADEWLDMVKKEVLPNTPMAIVLLVALSSVIVPLLATKYPVGNGIVHLCAVSNAGKSTAGYLATSISGEPFLSSKKEPDENNVLVTKLSLLQSFSATENALLGKLAGFNGVPIVLDELGKYRGKDLKSLIFDVFDGNSKSRMTKDFSIEELPGFCGTVITMGETSILDKTSAKLEGLYNRVFQIKEKLTTSAENSKAIKKVCMEHNGRIAPRFANYILKNGCVDFVAEKYEKWIETLSTTLPKVKFVDKFIENFPAVYLTTAEIAKDALGLDFDIEAIVKYFYEYLADDENTMDVSSQSYDYLIKEFASNSSKFYEIPSANNVVTTGTIWGRYDSKSAVNTTNKFGKRIIGEYSVRENILDNLLNAGGYTKNQCIKAWKEKDLISYEDGKNYRRRIVDVNRGKEKVFVFYIFDITEIPQTPTEKEQTEDVNKQFTIIPYPQNNSQAFKGFVPNGSGVR